MGSEFRRDERANMSILFAFGFTISALVSAVAVDAASLYQERRLLQAGVDLAAIAAAAEPSRAVEIVQTVLVGARLLAPASMDGLTVVTGRYDPAPALIADRFTPGGLPANAVSVTLERPGTLYFAGGLIETPRLHAAGIASVTPEVSFSLGSRLASLNGGLANEVLSRLLGTTVSLSIADYTALAAARIDTLLLLDAVGQRIGVTAGTYDHLLAMDARSGTVAAALASLTTGAARTALNAIAGGGAGHAVPLSKLARLGQLGGLQVGSGSSSGFALSALETLVATASVADGDRQASVNLAASVPGLVSLKLDLAIGERPQGAAWFAAGPPGTMVRTAQVRMRIKADMLGGSALLGAGVSLPLWLDLAQSEAQVVSASCPSVAAPRGSARLAVLPGAARLGLGTLSDAALNDFAAPVPHGATVLINALVLRISASAQVNVAQTAPIQLDFSSAEIAAGTVKTARTTTPVASLAGSLLGTLDLTVSVLGIGLSPPATFAQALRNLLAPMAPTLDLTISGALAALGLGVGEADVRVYGVRCDRAVLVG
ncbi:TadG family pilus assembly protein [Devosia lucknowensis]|nr:TadG family pilus assembly protein [Devosia lucknowensis]